MHPNIPAPALEAPPVEPPTRDQSFFYHSIDLGDAGIIKGQFDLGPHLHNYWAGANFENQTVLEIGPASGFLTARLERAGGEVTALELAQGADWDVIPYRDWDSTEFKIARSTLQMQLRNSFWHTHNALSLDAKLLLGSVYNIPEAVGDFDCSTICAVLLHLRHPLEALEQVTARTKKQIVIAEPLPGECLDQETIDLLHGANRTGQSDALLQRIGQLSRAQLADPAALFFRPDHTTQAPKETWWSLPPAAIEAWLGVMGFRVDAFKLYLLEHDSTYAFHKPSGHQDRKTFHPYWSISATRVKG